MCIHFFGTLCIFTGNTDTRHTVSPYVLTTPQLVICVPYCKEINKQMTIEHNKFYKISIQLKASMKRSHHQAGCTTR